MKRNVQLGKKISMAEMRMLHWMPVHMRKHKSKKCKRQKLGLAPVEDMENRVKVVWRTKEETYKYTCIKMCVVKYSMT